MHKYNLLLVYTQINIVLALYFNVAWKESNSKKKLVVSAIASTFKWHDKYQKNLILQDKCA